MPLKSQIQNTRTVLHGNNREGQTFLQRDPHFFLLSLSKKDSFPELSSLWGLRESCPDATSEPSALLQLGIITKLYRRHVRRNQISRKIFRRTSRSSDKLDKFGVQSECSTASVEHCQ
ncbi:hypothetical protein AVEN_128155-1 [Araneus ventricosus]|uniref:Uncharacterized protein n=1 Tax=Araneus ventricosus TaxID=182803 RepID=A0A4Y1ZZS3_ARAVE|nr:hypothetical protein AVEN_128155-1 [Araneus ventricosus]